MATCGVPEQEQPSEQSPPPPAQAAASQSPQEQDYEFVQPPDQDYYCPVTLEILLEPLQTYCCGQHISQQAANRIIKMASLAPCAKMRTLLLTQISISSVK